MKTTFTFLKNRAALFLFVLALGLTFTNCSNDDDGAPVTYNFDADFANVGELPGLVDEEPVFTEPNIGKVQNSAETAAIISDLQDGDGSVSAETQSKLNAVESFTDGLSASIQDKAQNLDAAGIEAILNATEFTGDLAALESALENAPAAVLALLPTIEYSSDFNGRMSLTNNQKGGVVMNPTVSDLYSMANTGPCFDAAKSAFEKAKIAPTAAKDGQLVTVDANYTRRLTEADARLAARTTVLATTYTTAQDELKNTAVALLGIADNLESTDANLAAQVRLLTLIFAVKASSALTEWNTSVTNLLTVLLAEEKNLVETKKDTVTGIVNSNFADIMAKLNAALNAAFNKCHNQGGGN